MSTPSDDEPRREPLPWPPPEPEQGGWQSSWEQGQPGGWQSQWQQPEPNQWQQPQTPRWTGYQPSPPTPGNAVASLILGIVSIVMCPIITAVIGLILGYNAKREIDNSGGRLGGRGVAMGGIITSWIGLAIYTPLLILFIIGISLV